jgi:hypothetical protein
MKTNLDELTDKAGQKTWKGFFLVVLIVMSMLLIVRQVAAAQNETGQTDENAQAQPKNLNDYFRGKYNHIDFVTSDVRQTTIGPKGHLNISSDIIIGNVQAMHGEHGRSRAIARAFIEEEVVLFGITDLKELREEKVYKSDLNYIFVLYKRYINNLELKGMYIDITINTKEKISSVVATLVPVSPEAYEATTKKTLPESRIREIALRDLRSSGDDQHLGEIKKYVIDEPPYVIWEIMSRYLYRIDAFTGEILYKESTTHLCF